MYIEEKIELAEKRIEELRLLIDSWKISKSLNNSPIELNRFREPDKGINAA
tara:strand:- start:290 stop:442 length:153 start_codon:yes stop_codon:yes gene_type:complete